MPVDEDPFKPDDDPWGEKKEVKAVIREEPEGEVGLSVKFGTGYEVPMFHVKAKNVYVLADLVGYVPIDPGAPTRKFAAGLLEYWTNVARIVQANYKASKPAVEDGPEEAPKATSTRTGTASNRSSSGGPRGGGSRPAPRQKEDDADTDWMYDREVPPECEHGEWKPVTKVSTKNNRRWYAWGHPGREEGSCNTDLQFVDAPKN